MTDTTRKSNLEFGVRNNTKAGLSEIKQDVRAVGDEAAQAGSKAGAAFDGMGKSSQAAAANIDRSTRSIINSLEREMAAMQAGGKGTADYYETIAKQRNADMAALGPYLQQMRLAEKQAEESFKTMGMSARQMSAAMRGVPAQISDIVVSLQGGMPVMTVFMQQGFQLRDMFGGFGPAAKALGSSLLGLVNPYTAAAAGVVALTATMLHAESTLRTHMTLMNQLEATGRAGFLNADAVKQLKNDMAELPGISRSMASSIISDLVQVRTLGGEALQKIALMSADFAAATGQDAAGAAKELAKAMEEPDKAARALDEAFNFLTLQQLIAIDAMVEAGDKAGAQKLLLDALGQSLSGTAEKQTEMQKASKELSNAWDDLMQSMSPSVETMHAVSSGLAGVARGINSITEAIPRANAEITKWLPGMQAMMGPLGMWARIKGLKAIEAEASATASSAAAVAATAIGGGAGRGSVNPPLVGSTGAKSEADQDLSTLLNTTKAFKAKKDAIEELNQTLGRLQSQQQRLRDEGRGDSKEAGELQSRIDGVNEKIKSLSKTRSDGSKKEQTAYAELAASIQAKIDTNKAEVDQSGKLNEAQKAEIKLNADLKDNKIKLSAAHEADLRKRIEIWKQQEKDKEQAKQNVAMYQQQLDIEKQVTEDYLKRARALESARQAMDAYEKSAKEDHERLQLEAGLIGMSNQARAVALAQYDAELELKRRLAAIDKMDSLNGGADLEELRVRERTIYAVKLANAQTKAYNDEWSKSYDQASQSLSDALMDGGRNGADYVAGLFRSLVLRPVVQAIVAQPASYLASAVTSMMGVGQPGGAAAGLIENGLNIASIGKNISSAITGGFEALSTTVGGWISSAGSYLGSTGMTGFGMGMQGMTIDAALKGTYGSSAAAGAGFGPYMQGAAGVLGGVYGGRLISGGYSAFGGASGNSAVNTGTAIGATIGSIVPVIGTALGALVGGLLGGTVNRLFGRKLADQGIEGTFGGDTAFEGNAYRFMKGGLFRSDKTERSALDEELRKGLADQYSVMRLSTATMAEVLGLGTAAIDGFTSSIKVSFNGLSAEESEKRLTEEFDKVAESLAGVALGTTDYTRAGETAVQAITRLSGSLTAVNGVFDQLSTTLYASSLAGADMSSSLLGLFGGADGFGTATGTYFQNFYSGEEQRAALERQLNAALAKVNLQLPDIDQDSAREQYRALADAQDLTTESGRKAWATLMQLSGSFAQLTKSAEDVAAAAVAAAEEAAKAAEEAAKVMTGLLSDRRQLEAELMQAQGNATGYAAAMRSIATEGFGPAELAAYDYNEALRDQIDVMTEAAAAAERAASERMSLETRLLTLQGDTAALRQRELVALDASNRALQLHIWAIEDAQAAYTAATTAAQGAYSGLERSVSAQRSILQDQYNAQKAALQEQSNAAKAAWQAQVSAAQKAASEMGSIASMLGNAFSAVEIDSPELSRARLQAAQSLIVDARDRNDVRATGLEDALGVASGDTARMYGKWDEWAFQQGVTAAAVGDLYGEAQKQLSAQEQLIAQLQASDGVAQAISDAEMAAMDALYQQELGLLDATLETGKSQLNALLGIDDSVLSVADAVARLSLSMNAAEAARQSVAAAMASAAASGGGTGEGWTPTPAPVYTDEQLLAMGLDPAGVNSQYDWLKSNGATSAVSPGEFVFEMLLKGRNALSGVIGSPQYADLNSGRVYETSDFTDAQFIQASKIGGLPDEASRAEYLRKILEQSINGSHADGLAYVPFDGYRAELHKGERVLTAEENRLYTPNSSAMGGGSGVIKSLVAEIAKLQARLAEISANTNATAAWVAATDRKLNRVIRNNAIATTPETA